MLPMGNSISPLLMAAMMRDQQQQQIPSGPQLPNPLQRGAGGGGIPSLIPPQMPGQQGAGGMGGFGGFGGGFNPMQAMMLAKMFQGPISADGGSPTAQGLYNLGGSGLLGALYGGMPE